MRFVKLVFISLCATSVLAACGGGEGESSATSLPTPVPPTLVPTSTPTAYSEATSPASVGAPDQRMVATVQPTVEVLIEAEEGEEVPPPVDAALPEGWRREDRMHLYQEVDNSLNLLPISIYWGPVTGGTGYIILAWAFENIVTVNPVTGRTGEVDLFTDALRLLRLAVIEPGCTIGKDYERPYEVGGVPAIGTTFWVLGCADTVDTRGWFVVLQVQGINFAFYIYAEPLEAMNNGIAESELQSILDSITFHVDDLLLTPEPRD